MSGKKATRISESGHDITSLDEATVEAMGQKLDPQAYRITMKSGTEPAFTGEYWDHKEPGVYACTVCGLPLFSADTKFDSGTGWPSFDAPIDPEHLATVRDRSWGMTRTEVRCARSGSHLGHVFDDGPTATGKRFCINSAALSFIPEGAPVPEASRPVELTGASPAKVATFGAGCFWGVEHAFRQLEGVVATRVGFSGGTVADPTYRQVCTGETGHAEVVEVRYDPAALGYEDLLEVFWSSHDPTQRNRQGPDVGTQYRSVIFYHDESQREAALASREALDRSGRLFRPVVTEIAAAGPFYPAEEYHQQYLEKNGMAACPAHLKK